MQVRLELVGGRDPALSLIGDDNERLQMVSGILFVADDPNRSTGFQFPSGPGGRVCAAAGPTVRSKSAFELGFPWIGTCWETSSFSRLMLL